MNKIFVIITFLCCALHTMAQGQIHRTQKTENKQSVEISKSDGYINGHGYVDLGLPSGTKWAVCNIGANNSTDIGNYYSWGESDVKSTYKYDEAITMFQDLPDISGSVKYDTAKKLWGESWTMPTVEQWKELFSKTKVKYVKLNSAEGFIFRGRNNKTLFIPYGGYQEGNSPYLWAAGRYWTSNADYRYHGESPLYPENAYSSACYFELFNDKPELVIDAEWRGSGRPIRPVCH